MGIFANGLVPVCSPRGCSPWFPVAQGSPPALLKRGSLLQSPTPNFYSSKCGSKCGETPQFSRGHLFKDSKRCWRCSTRQPLPLGRWCPGCIHQLGLERVGLPLSTRQLGWSQPPRGTGRGLVGGRVGLVGVLGVAGFAAFCSGCCCQMLDPLPHLTQSLIFFYGKLMWQREVWAQLRGSHLSTTGQGVLVVLLASVNADSAHQHTLTPSLTLLLSTRHAHTNAAALFECTHVFECTLVPTRLSRHRHIGWSCCKSPLCYFSFFKRNRPL